LELQPNQAKILELRSDAIVGKNTYGEYQLFIVSNGSNEELSFFCPNEKIYEQLKVLKKGDHFEITKTAKQNGKGIMVDYEIVVLEDKMPQTKNGNTSSQDNYFDLMLRSYEDALKINEKLQGLVDVSRIAVTLFIARSKINGNGFGGVANV